jgi:hypothetical protein
MIHQEGFCPTLKHKGVTPILPVVGKIGQAVFPPETGHLDLKLRIENLEMLSLSIKG